MAIEIVHRGALPEDKKYEGKCSYCRTVIAFKRADARYVCDQRDGDYLEVQCPVCSRPITTSV